MWHHQLRILDPESFSQCEWSESRWEMIIWVSLEIGVQNHGFSYRKPLKTPWIMLKPSSSRNFQVAIASGNQPWFAGKFLCLVHSSMFAGISDLLLVISSLVRQQVQCMLLLQRQRHINTHLAKRYRGFTNGWPQIQKPARWTETWDPGRNVICSFLGKSTNNLGWTRVSNSNLYAIKYADVICHMCRNM